MNYYLLRILISLIISFSFTLLEYEFLKILLDESLAEFLVFLLFVILVSLLDVVFIAWIAKKFNLQWLRSFAARLYQSEIYNRKNILFFQFFFQIGSLIFCMEIYNLTFSNILSGKILAYHLAPLLAIALIWPKPSDNPGLQVGS